MKVKDLIVMLQELEDPEFNFSAGCEYLLTSSDMKTSTIIGVRPKPFGTNVPRLTPKRFKDD